jgi:hypothetical protein
MEGRRYEYPFASCQEIGTLATALALERWHRSDEPLALRPSIYESISSVFRKSVELWHTPCNSQDVLKITINKTPALMRWVLQGRLVEPWVSELRTNWKKAYRSRKVCTCVIDLNDVTSVDRAGEKLLRSMSKEGAHFIANGLYIRHVLEGLEVSGKPKLAG